MDRQLFVDRMGDLSDDLKTSIYAWALMTNHAHILLKGIKTVNQPHLTGGGLIQSMGAWSQVKALRRIGEKEEFDGRVSSTEEFVKKITKDIGIVKKHRLTSIDREKKVKELIKISPGIRDKNIIYLKN